MCTYKVSFFVPELSRIKIDRSFCFLPSKSCLPFIHQAFGARNPTVYGFAAVNITLPRNGLGEIRTVLSIAEGKCSNAAWKSSLKARMNYLNRMADH